jgi:hypothetical protein
MPTKGDILVVSHDLSQTGAPVVLRAARHLAQNDFFVTIIAPLAARFCKNVARMLYPRSLIH